MGKKHKKHHRNDWKVDDQPNSSSLGNKPLKLVLKIGSGDSNDASSPHRKKKKKSHHQHASSSKSDEVQTVEICTDAPQPLDEVQVPQYNKEQKKAVEELLDSLLAELQRKDPQKIFAWPVNDIIAPKYSQIISYPMDFSTMQQKVEKGEYSGLGDFRHDFDIMIENCKRYNKEDTIYHKAAKKLKYSGRKILSKERLIGLRQAMPSLMSAFTTPEYYSLVGVPMPEDYNEDNDVTMASSIDETIQEVSFTDADSVRTVAPDSLAAAQLAHKRVQQLRPNDRIGALQQKVSSNEDGTKKQELVLNILNPQPDEVEDKVRLVDLTPVLDDGIDTLPVVKEDKRNKITPVEYLGYGSFSSFAPTYDSRLSNITQSQSDMLLSVYGSETGLMFAQSMKDFVGNSHPEVQSMVDDLLDNLTHGGHRTAQEELDQNSKLLQSLEQQQKERLQQKPLDGKPNLTLPSEKECQLAGQIQTNLTNMASRTHPGNLYNEEAVRDTYTYID